MGGLRQNRARGERDPQALTRAVHSGAQKNRELSAHRFFAFGTRPPSGGGGVFFRSALPLKLSSRLQLAPLVSRSVGIAAASPPQRGLKGYFAMPRESANFDFRVLKKPRKEGAR